MDQPTIVLGSHDAKTRLAELLDQVEQGAEIVITRRGRPIARLTSIGPGHDVAAAEDAATALLALRDRIAARIDRPFTAAERHDLRTAGRRF